VVVVASVVVPVESVIIGRAVSLDPDGGFDVIFGA
jgi:hypothetical protein